VKGSRLRGYGLRGLRARGVEGMRGEEPTRSVSMILGVRATW